MANEKEKTIQYLSAFNKIKKNKHKKVGIKKGTN